MLDTSNGETDQEIDLNLAPIIDCFTVLITYLLVTASFLTLTSLDVSISASNPSLHEPPAVEKVPPLVMTLDIAPNQVLIVKVSGGTLQKEVEIKLPPTARKLDQQALESTLQKINARWTNLSEVSVSASSSVLYRDLVSVINTIQKYMPKVYISAG